jgi:hypothetical protein
VAVLLGHTGMINGQGFCRLYSTTTLGKNYIVYQISYMLILHFVARLVIKTLALTLESHDITEKDINSPCLNSRFEKFTEYAMNVPLLMVHRNHQWHYVKGATFMVTYKFLKKIILCCWLWMKFQKLL